MKSIFNNKLIAGLIIFLVIAITAWFGRFARQDKIDNRLEDNVLANDSLAAYYRFLSKFGNDRILLIGFNINKIDASLVRVLFKSEIQISSLSNIQTIISPVSLLRAQLGVRTEEDLEKFLEEPRQLERYLENLHLTKSLEGIVISKDRKVGGMVIRLEQEKGDFVGKTIKQIREILDKNFPFQYYFTGVPELTRLILEMTRKDQKLFAPLTILIIGLMLFFLYRSVFGIFVPLLVISSAFIWTKGLLIACGNSVNFVTSILPPLILSIALTYVIHLLTFYFQESQEHEFYDPKDLIATVRHVSKPILLSGGTTIIGFGSLMYNKVQAISQFGLYSAIGTFFSMLLTLVVAPAAIIAWRRKGGKVASVSFLEVWLKPFGETILAHPGKVWFFALICTVISLIGLTKLPIETSLIRYLPDDHSVQSANIFIENNLCGIVPVEILLESNERRWTEPEMTHKIRRIQETFHSVSRLDRSLSFVDLVQDFDRMFSSEPYHIPPSEEEICDYLNFYSPIASDTEEEETEEPATYSFAPFQAGGILGEFIASDAMTARIAIRFKDSSSKHLVAGFENIRSELRKTFAGVQVQATLTGRAVMWAEVSEILVFSEITSFGFALLIITAVFVVFFRSIRMGIAAMIPNILPMLFTFGIMGFTGTTFNTVTGMIASIAIGLAVDDTLHFIYQYRTELINGYDEKTALIRTIIHKGRATIFTSLVLISGFSVLSISSFGPTRYFGIFISIAVFNALICDLAVTPISLLTFKPFKNVTLK